MRKKRILLLSFVIYSTVILLLFLVKNEEVLSLKKAIKDNEIQYLKGMEENNNQYHILTNKIDALLEQQKILEGTIEELNEEKQELTNQIQELITIDGASIEGLKNMGISDYTQIANDLLSHSELIPYDGALGGTMRFSKIFILNDKWAYGRFEDGHIQGYGLYEYKIDKDKNISWKVIDSILDENE